MKFSVIIPVYNVEKYLKQCLDSVINQTFKDIEIICVNDGSIDSSLDILHKYSQCDNRIKVFSQENSGVSAARNLGLSKACGEYIMFLDADDTYDLNLCQKAAEKIDSENPDIVGWAHNFVKDGKFTSSNIKLLKKLAKNYTKLRVSRQLSFQVFVWNKAYKREFLLQNDINFPVGVSCAEDMVFCVSAYLAKPKYSFIEEELYFYNIMRDGSLTTQNLNCIQNDFNAYKYISKTKEYERQQKGMKLLITNHFMGGSVMYWNRLKDENYSENLCCDIEKFLDYVKNGFSLFELFRIKNYRKLRNIVWKYNLKKNRDKTVVQSTVKHDLCINCGLCKVVCPTEAITLKKNKNLEYTPVIDKKKCVSCGLCAKYCVHTKQKLEKEALKVISIDEPHTYGLCGAQYFVAYDPDRHQRQKCCSGGAVTKLAVWLLENRKIDAMIHVERLWSKRGQLHYGARISSSVDEIKENVSSAYQPIDFSDVLDKLEAGKTYLITATPCVIRAVKYLFKNHKSFNKIKIFTCALICSHNTNSQYIDFLAETYNLSNKEDWQVNIRNKDDIPDANNFNNHIYTRTKDLLKMNRNESGWTHNWRSYYFAMNVCNYCPDFWGYEGDISVKDAWGEWASDPLGKSIVVVRNDELKNYINQCGLVLDVLDYEIMRNHQAGTSIYKQTESKNKMFSPFYSQCNRKNGLFKNKIISLSTKFLYRHFGCKITRILMPAIEFIAEKGAKI